VREIGPRAPWRRLRDAHDSWGQIHLEVLQPPVRTFLALRVDESAETKVARDLVWMRPRLAGRRSIGFAVVNIGGGDAEGGAGRRGAGAGRRAGEKGGAEQRSHRAESQPTHLLPPRPLP